MDVTQNAAFVLFAAVSPLLIAVIKQAGFPAQANAAIAFVGYVVVGIAGALVSGEPLTWENATVLASIAMVVGSATYNLLWSKLGGDEKGNGSIDQRLTAATSIVK